MPAKTNHLHVCFNYMQSTLDYFGLLTWMMLNRCGHSVIRQIDSSFIEPFRMFKHPKGRLYKQSLIREIHIQPDVDPQRLIEINETIQRIELRLQQLEANHHHKQPQQATKRKVDKQQFALLQQIVMENKELKQSKKNKA
ncbi:MAG: hypothetical protein HQK75_08775 [Candidatus Magnetomorum sp.]|nr:hypothetical protein [Candidatus Magnetomorum sp.]